MCREIGDFVQAKQERILQVIKAVGEIGLGYVGRRTFQNSKMALKAHRTGLEVLLHHLTTRPRTAQVSASLMYITKYQMPTLCAVVGTLLYKAPSTVSDK